MNHYLRLINQPMQIRFEFRKNQGCLVATDETMGRLYMILTIGTNYNEQTKKEKGLSYGPYATPIVTTKGIWGARHSNRLTQKSKVQDLNRQMMDLQDKLEQIHINLERKINEEQSGLMIDGPMVIDYWKRSKSLAPVTLADVYTEFMAWRKSIIELDRRKRRPEQISLATYKTHQKWWVLIQQYLHQKKQSCLPVMNVEYATATNLVEWMIKQHISRGAKTRTYAQASISKTVKLLKMLLNYAQSKGYVKYNVLATFSISSGSPADPKPLTSEQMNQLEMADLPPALRHQCDSWLIAAELCLHYADYSELRQITFVTSESGQLFIQHDRAKQSGSKLIQTVNVTPRALRLLEKYNGPHGLYYGSNAYWSKILKRIATQADLRDETGGIVKLQFGQGRDTGLTQRAIQGANGIQLSKVAGWSKPVNAERYVGNPLSIVEAFACGIKTRLDSNTANPFPNIYKAS